MYGIPDSLRPLSPAEEEALLAVWAAGLGASRRAGGAQLADRHWADATVLTLLRRLEAKGWLRVAQEGNRNLYTPTVTRRAYGVACMRERLDKLFGGDVAAAVKALVSESGATPTQLAAAAAVLDEAAAKAEEYDDYDLLF